VLIGAIIAYYFLATILPIDKIIGRIYPVFGAVLIFMALGTITMLISRATSSSPRRPSRTSTPRACPCGR
jgi:carbon starvation protein CstA